MIRLNGLERWMINRVGAAEGDVRDWENIVSRAKDIAGDLLKEEEKN